MRRVAIGGGGGTGKYKHIPGDVPRAMGMGEKWRNEQAEDEQGKLRSSGGTVHKDVKDGKGSKDSKDSKGNKGSKRNEGGKHGKGSKDDVENKDGEENKEWKGSEDNEDGKDSKGGKDSKDGKDSSKDHKDSKDDKQKENGCGMMTTDWTQLHINIRAMTTDETINELMMELDDAQWDAITINETWRASKEEEEQLENKHLWFGSGGTAGKHGVGIFVNKRWSKKVQRFRAVSSRLAAVDVSLSATKTLRIISAYFPHSGYSDDAVDRMHKELEELVEEARKAKMILLIGADCNAEVGGPRCFSSSYGGHGNPTGNALGEWLRAWTERFGLVLANTYFKKSWEKVWTHESTAGRKRQIDYLMLDRSRLGAVRDSEVTRAIDMGSDHRCLIAKIRIQARKRKKWKQKKQTYSTFKEWQAADLEEYVQKLEDACRDEKMLDKLEEASTRVEDKCKVLLDTVMRTADQCRHIDAEDSSAREGEQQEVKQLIEARKEIREPKSDSRKALSKSIQKKLSRQMRTKRRQRIGKLIEDFSGLRKITSIKAQGKRELLPHMIDKDGVRQDGRQEIADVLADFYADLYATRGESQADQSEWETDPQPIPELTEAEVEDALKKMKRRKASDKSGVVAELLKDAGESVRRAIAMIFNDVAVRKMKPPAEWKEYRITVIFKKGDRHKADNYRPIILPPILYKLFSRMIQCRIKRLLEEAQPIDQAGFRSGYSCADHLFTVVQLSEKMDEFQLPLWICAVDFKKAFDTVEHEAIWRALHTQKVHPGYISILAELYQGQAGKVIADKESKSFGIQRGTKQGDPISPNLFSAVLEEALSSTKSTWIKKRFGIQVGKCHEDRLTNLRFADDILLIGTSQQMITTMLEDLQLAAGRVGLELHLGKTKILTNEFAKRSSSQAGCRIQGAEVEILQVKEAIMYLGRSLCLKDARH